MLFSTSRCFPAAQTTRERAPSSKVTLRTNYTKLLHDDEFSDFISRAVDHIKRTKRRFEIWEDIVGQALR